MESVRCSCGVEVSGANENALFLAFRDHVDQAHPRWQPPDESLRAQLREVLAQQAQMAPWDGALLPIPAGVEIRPLTPDRLEDFLQFFDREGFRDNPFWASCYCMEAHSTESGAWTPGEAARNRAQKSALIRSGVARGYLAYAENRPIGWCHAAPRTSLAGLTANEEFHVDDPDGVGAIYCFVIAPPYRRQGLAARLITEAVEGFRTEGLRIAEGYPPKETRSAGGGYHGTLEMFEAAGFSRYRETPQNVIVRKHLA